MSRLRQKKLAITISLGKFTSLPELTECFLSVFVVTVVIVFTFEGHKMSSHTELTLLAPWIKYGSSRYEM